MFAGLDGLQTIAQCQADLLELQMLVYQGGHLVVNGCHHLVKHFDQGNLNTAMRQVFSDLQANKPAANHHSSRRLLFINEGLDPVHIGQVAQCENTRQVHTRQRRHDRCSAW